MSEVLGVVIRFQVKQQQVRAKKMRDQAELEDLIKLELKHKEKELQAGLERERIGRELKKVRSMAY